MKYKIHMGNTFPQSTKESFLEVLFQELRHNNLLTNDKIINFDVNILGEMDGDVIVTIKCNDPKLIIFELCRRLNREEKVSA